MTPDPPPVTRVARVAVDLALPHLDRLFDYLIPESLAEVTRAGVRCRVRFAGRLRDGFVIEVVDHSEVAGPLAPLERVSSGEVVLTPEVVTLVRAVADHYAGTFSDVVRLAVPARHAATEAAQPAVRPAPHAQGLPEVLPGYHGGPEFLAGLGAGRPLRAAWCPLPARSSVGDPLGGVLDAVGATLAAGRGAIVVVPDAGVLSALVARAETTFGRGSIATLSADAGPSVRYRNFLAVARGAVRLVVGTRGAVYAPLPDLGLVAVWDEGNDSYDEPRAPYPHVREVAALRASVQGCGLLLAGYARSAETQALVERGWLAEIGLAPGATRRQAPVVRVAADHDSALERDPAAAVARLPRQAFELLRLGLASGPVLVQVPRAGYVASASCQGCRTLARCPACTASLRGERGASGLELVCSSCGPLPTPWACPVCGDRRLRAPRVGVGRTAEELGKAFPGVRVVASWSGHPVAAVSEEPAIVLATPGSEPWPAAGYAAALLLDTAQLLGRPDLRSAEEALRRWLAVCALVRPAEQGGTVLAVGDASSRALQALVRLDPVGFAERELAERAATRFPPAAKLVVVEGDPEAIVAWADLPWADAVPGCEVFGPAPAEGGLARLTLRTPLAQGRALVGAVRAELGVRSARKDAPVRVRVDPAAVG